MTENNVDRRAVDEAALAEARARAELTARDLLAALAQGPREDLHDLLDVAQQMRLAADLLWETTARLADHQ